MRRLVLVCCVGLLAASRGPAQTAQVGGDARARGSERITFEYVHYRPAKWNTEQITELENEFPNQGGLIYLYFRNNGGEPLDLRYWRANGQDESYWVLNHFVAWHRLYRNGIPPGGLGVLEINATAGDFGPGREFSFAWVDRSWRPVGTYSGVLEPDPVQISYLRVLPGMQEVEVHVRHTGGARIRFGDVRVEGHEVTETDWRARALDGAGHTIARAKLARPLQPAELLVAGVEVRGGGSARAVHAHRRAFEDYFPIGIWTNGPDLWDTLHRLHIDTMVGPRGADDAFYTEAAPKYGFRSMVHTGMPLDVDAVRGLADNPSVLCWMIRDEPDWSIPPNVMLYADEEVRRNNRTKPTFITLCRNIKFMEYAPIADIPCQDHYSVTAPSSSKWPFLYGTRLEETAWYTEDLRYASEPKGVWVWTQGIADWGQRVKRPVPTPEEAAAQLVLNLGRGAKGILWFNWHRERATVYTDIIDAMRGWGRVMKVLREDFLASEPALLDTAAPDQVDVAPLLNWDNLVLCLTNTDYDIHPEAYPFREKTDVAVSVALPAWLEPAAALHVAPDGIHPLPLETEGGRATLTLPKLHDTAVVVLANDSNTQAAYEAAYQAARAVEE